MSNLQNIGLEKMAGVFKALSNPHRLKIFVELVSCCSPGTVHCEDAEGGRYVGQLAEGLQLAPSTVSHHLKELRQAGLLIMTRKGQNIECWVNPDVLKDLSAFFSI